jgi:uncharacterized protein (DUF2141 family)
MKAISVTVLIVFLTSLHVTAQVPLTLVVKNVKASTGTIRVGIFKDENTFLKEAWIGKVVKAEKGEITVVFEEVPAGKYGISVIHDENENGELDSNFIGVPTEGFGFGNDAMGTFGPPDFEKASVEIGTGKVSITVNMRYL